ncbi:DNRLRE domain-containing protein [Streptomyces cinnabarinus]|uniref:DNRLRE domain-containing protein n=1 Tax=Streptomyces cinnabarinus TaxID=67287 RepID=A0ABY7KJZ9_9ACTN|nr:DNRLRE domain-containing protein [Streptomyces cinnabarinus]WAZ23051.1 DNRLRE domain-containing protein [Streptomyces cinnabarinus]
MRRTNRRRWIQATAAMTLAGSLTASLAGDPSATLTAQSDRIVNSPAKAVTLGDDDPDIAKLLGLSEEEAARRNAKIQNRRIELVSQRTGTSTVYVNPDGTLTAESYAGPVRVQREDGSWQPIDTQLADEGAALEPEAAAADITVSDGGDKKLASVSQGGVSMALGWEDTLPTPTVRDDTASYDLGEGQTLTVTALKQGFSQNVVLDEAPGGALVYRMPVSLKGLTLSETDSGRLLLKNGAGKLVAEAPAPMMWDSSVDRRSGESKHLAAVDTEIETAADGTQTLVLRPDADYFAQDLTYPVTVDPTSTLAVTTDTWVATNYPDSQVSSTELKSGTYNGGSTVARSFLKFDVSGYEGVHVIDTNLALYSYWSSACTVGTGTAVRRVTESWSSSTITWADPPASTTTGQVVNTAAKGYSADCPAGTMNFDIDTIVRAWTGGTANYGLMVRGVDETDSYTWRRFHSANHVSGDGSTEPHLTITYNSYPEVPGATSLSPSTGAGVVTSRTPVLSTFVNDGDPQRVRVQYAIEPDPAYNDTTYALTTDTPYVDTAEVAALAVPEESSLPDGKHLRMRARTYDGTDYSTAWSAWKNFSVDTAKAPAPDVPFDLATGAVETTTPLLTGVVTAAGQGAVSAEYLLQDTAGNAVGSPLTATVQDGDRAVVKVPEGLLTDGTAYRWKMRACADAVCSAYTALQSFTPDVTEEPGSSGTTGTAPEAVTDLRAVPGEHGALVTWSAAEFTGEVDDAVTYTVTAVASDGTTAGTRTTTGLSAVFDDLAADAGDVTYTFQVTGTNDYGTGPSTTSAAIAPVAVTGGTDAYSTAVQAYHFARGGLVQGSYVDASDAAANSAYGAQFASLLAKDQEALLRERVAGSADDSDNVSPDATFSDVLAIPSADGRQVTLRATVHTSDTIVTDVSTATADPTDQTGETEMRYTFSAGADPVLLSAVTAAAKEVVVRPTRAAFADFANDINEESAEPTDLVPSEFDGDSTDDGTETGATAVSHEALQAGTYLRTGAATWAVSNWDAPAMYAQDCTNFVSRAVHFGGSVKMKGGIGDRPYSVDAWWRKKGILGPDETYTWVVSGWLKKFTERNMLHSKRNTSNAYVGDIIFYDWDNNGVINHASIITKISNGKIYVTQHNKNYKYRSLAAQKSAEPRMKIWIYRPQPKWY